MLTAAQQQTLKAYVEADPVLSLITPSTDNAFVVADALNANAPGPYIVWKTTVTAQEIMSNGFVWTAVDSLTVGKARIWDWLTRFGTINPSKPNVRQGVADCFGAGSAMVTAILPHCKRPASVAEKVLATGTGTDAAPALMGFEGRLSYTDVINFMVWY